MKNNSKLKTLTEDSIVELAKGLKKQMILMRQDHASLNLKYTVAENQVAILEKLKAALDASPKKKPAKAVKPKRVSKVASKVPKK